jgi:RNA polymerase sigma-70 factor (ECF subfamily)
VDRTASARIDTRERFFLSSAMAHAVDAVVSETYRSEWGRVLATIIRLTNDFDLAEEAAQEAFAAALDRWRDDGVPEQRRFLERRLREVE